MCHWYSSIQPAWTFMIYTIKLGPTRHLIEEPRPNENKQRSHSHHSCRQPAAARRSARRGRGQGAGQAGRREGPCRAAARRRGRDRAPADRARHRRDRRRRVRQAELRLLCQRAPRRLRDRQGGAARQPMGELARSQILSRVLCRRARVRAPEPHGVHCVHHLSRQGAIAGRHRQPEGRSRWRRAGGGVHAGDLADQRGGLAAQRLLQDRGGVSVRAGRCATRGIRGDRAGGISAAGRRPASRHLLDQGARSHP